MNGLFPSLLRMPVWRSTALVFAAVFAVTLGVLQFGLPLLAVVAISLGLALFLAGVSGLAGGSIRRAGVVRFAVVLTVSLVVLASAALASDGTVTIPYGQWLTDWSPLIASGLAALVAWGFRQLPANIAAILGNARVELLINNAIGYGLNAVKDASKGKTLSADVGNQVLAEALQYGVDNAPAWLLAWAGGPEGLAKKIFGRLDLEPAADAGAIKLVTTTVKAGAKAGG